MSQAPETKWRRAETMVVWGLCVALLMALAWLWTQERGWLGSGPTESLTPESRVQRPVEANTATAADFQHVRGIGEKHARDIVYARETLIREQRRDKKIKSVGWRNIDEFIASVKSMPGFSFETENELRRVVRVEPLSR